MPWPPYTVGLEWQASHSRATVALARAQMRMTATNRPMGRRPPSALGSKTISTNCSSAGHAPASSAQRSSLASARRVASLSRVKARGATLSAPFPVPIANVAALSLSACGMSGVSTLAISGEQTASYWCPSRHKTAQASPSRSTSAWSSRGTGVSTEGGRHTLDRSSRSRSESAGHSSSSMGTCSLRSWFPNGDLTHPVPPRTHWNALRDGWSGASGEADDDVTSEFFQ